MHPLAGDFSKFKDAEIEEKIGDLTRKYFQANHPEMKTQIANLLESYKEELSNRRTASWNKMMANRDKSLDKLININ